MGWLDDLMGAVGIKKTEKKDSAPKATPSSAKPADFDVRPPRAGSSGQPGSDLASLLSGGKPKEQGPIASPFAAQANAKRQQETAAQAAAAEAARVRAQQEKAADFVRQQAADQQAGPKTAVELLKAPAQPKKSLIEQLQAPQLAAAAEILTAAQAAPEAPAAEQVRTAAQAAPAGQERRPAPVADDEDEDAKPKPPSELDELALLLNMPLGSTTPPSSKPTGMIRTPGLEPGLAAKLEANVKVEPKKRPWWKLDENSTPIGGLGPGHTATQAKEATKLKERQGKEKTEQAPGVDEALSGQSEVKDLTRKEYLALNPRARAAVDFNTLLVDAVTADLEDGKTLGDDKLSAEQKKYQHNVNKMFGKDYGSKVYAPRTMALLEEIDFENREKGSAKADLDEFLNLDRGVHEDDLKYVKELDYQGMLTGKGSEDFKDQVVADRVTIQSRLVQGTEEMQKALINSGTFLDSFRNTALKELNAKVVDYGASEFDIKPAVGFGGTERDTSMSKLYDFMSGKNVTKTQIDDALNILQQEDIDGQEIPGVGTVTWKTKDYEKFFEYADRRTRNEIRLGRDNPVDGERRSAAEMRKLLDLSK